MKFHNFLETTTYYLSNSSNTRFRKVTKQGCWFVWDEKRCLWKDILDNRLIDNLDKALYKNLKGDHE